MNSRKYLFEFEDLPWFPSVLRESMTDYLRYILSLTNFYAPITTKLVQAMEKTASLNIIDLCSGGGGPIEVIKKNIEQEAGKKIRITLTDKYPNTNAYQFIKAKTNAEIDYDPRSVDAAAVPPGLTGFRTIFSGFHHFDDSLAKAVLQNAADNNAGIGIFDGADRNVFTILMITLIHPIAFMFLTPFFKPFRLSRIIFTYLIPLIPLFTIWDGIISITRLRTPDELLQLARSTGHNGYTWEAGRKKNRLGFGVAYLIGYPSEKNNESFLTDNQLAVHI
jgi:hypothetical protein